MQVNLEGFVLYNAAMNALLLAGTGRLSGLRARAWRLSISALAGTAYAVVSCLSFGLFLQAWYLRLLCALAMTAIVFAPSPPRQLLRAWLCFFICALLMGGTGFSILYLLGARGFGWGIALAVALLGVAGCVALAANARRARIGKTLRRVRLRKGERSAEFTAIVDTGNQLIEPISGLAVLVVEQRALGGIQAALGRPVAFRSMAGEGILPTFVPDSLWIEGHGEAHIAVAAYEGALGGDGQYAALLPAECATYDRRRAC